MTPRGLRNNNPGNIRRTARTRLYRGERSTITDPQFREFVALEWGYRAMFVLLYTYQHRYGLCSIRAMITRWAPPVENHTEEYIRVVCEAAGVSPDAPIDALSFAVMAPIAEAITRVENGQAADAEAIRLGWELFWHDFGPEGSVCE